MAREEGRRLSNGVLSGGMNNIRNARHLPGIATQQLSRRVFSKVLEQGVWANILAFVPQEPRLKKSLTHLSVAL